MGERSARAGSATVGPMSPHAAAVDEKGMEVAPGPDVSGRTARLLSPVPLRVGLCSAGYPLYPDDRGLSPGCRKQGDEDHVIPPRDPDKTCQNLASRIFGQACCDTAVSTGTAGAQIRCTGRRAPPRRAVHPPRHGTRNRSQRSHNSHAIVWLWQRRRRRALRRRPDPSFQHEPPPPKVLTI